MEAGCLSCSGPSQGLCCPAPHSARGAQPSQLSVYEQHLRELVNQQAPGPTPGLHLLAWGRVSSGNLDLKELRWFWCSWSSEGLPWPAPSSHTKISLLSSWAPHSTKSPHSVLRTFTLQFCTHLISVSSTLNSSAPWRQATCLALPVTELALCLVWRLLNNE